MALQTSGAISIDDIHQEAGGNSGTQCSIDDSDIRGLNAASGRSIDPDSGDPIDFADFYGASASGGSSGGNGDDTGLSEDPPGPPGDGQA